MYQTIPVDCRAKYTEFEAAVLAECGITIVVDDDRVWG